MARFTIDLREDIEKIMDRLADEENITKAELIKRSLFLYFGLKEEVLSLPDQRLAIVNGDNKVVTKILNPYWQNPKMTEISMKSKETVPA